VISYTLPEASRVSGLSIRTLYNAHDRGELPFAKIGRRTLIRHADLAALIDRNVIGAADDRR
jgi:excisionase family DNA binding protein